MVEDLSRPADSERRRESQPVESAETRPSETRERPPRTDRSWPDEARGLAALFDSRRATTVLLSLVAVLALVAGGLFAWDAFRDDDDGGRRRSSRS